MNKVVKGILGTFVAIIAVILVVFLVFVIAEYKPKAIEEVAIEGTASGTVEKGAPFKIMTWNTGYGALGDNADFFMDGGTMVMTCDKERVNANIEGISNFIKEVNPDFVFLQEVDKKATRSYKINEKKFFEENFSDYQSSFGTNFKVLYCPAGNSKGHIGQVDCGVLSLSRVPSKEAHRVQLPCPFSFPVRMFNLKRCLLITRVPVAGSDKELVLVNLHLEAYDKGEGKIAQTRMLKEIFDSEVAKGNYVIAGGDFNQTFSSVDTSKYPLEKGMWEPGIIETKDFSEGIQLLMDSSEPTCRSLQKVYKDADKENFRFYVIDGFIVSPNITVNSYKTVNRQFECTDHNPIVLSATLN